MPLVALPLAAIPISFGYCVARYQVLQIDMLMKRTLAYALLTATVVKAGLVAAFYMHLKWDSRVYTAFGHHHIGLTGGPKTGRLVAGLITGAQVNTDLAPYHPQRFS